MKLKKKKPLSAASLTAGGTTPNKYLGIRSDLVVALRTVCDLSLSTYGFTPTINYLMSGLSISVHTALGFAFWLDLPVWPAGSTHTTEEYAASIRTALGTSFAVGIGGVYMSVEYRP